MLASFAILLLTSLTRISAQSMVLSGIAISSMFSAGLTLMQYMADSVQLANIISWTFGDLGRSSWGSVLITAMVVIPISWLFFQHRWDFNAMGAGEELAKGLGIHTERVRILCMVAASLVSAMIVSFFGIIGFIGLLGPHIARQIIGGDHRYLLLASPLMGAVVLLAADTAARVVLAPMVLPVGILTSLLGGPLFIYLLIKGAKS
jgi:iron complex transport system permease protein